LPKIVFDPVVASLGSHNSYYASIYKLIGDVHLKQGIYLESLNYYQRAILAIATDFADTNIYVNPSLENLKPERYTVIPLAAKAEAFEKLSRFREIAGKTPANREKASNLKDLEMSLATYQLVSNLIDKIRSGYKAEGSKLLLGERSTRIHEQAIQTALSFAEMTGQGIYKENTFQFSERTKSAVLLQSLQDVAAKQFAGIPEKLLQKEKALKIKLAFYDTEIQKEKHEKQERDGEKIKAFENTFFLLKAGYESLMSDLEKEYPLYYDLKYQTRTVSVTDLQENLASNAALIEYFAGDSALHIFVISKDQFEIIASPMDSSFIRLVDSFYSAVRKADTPKYLFSAYELHKLLIEPVARQIASKEKLIIIPHNMLYKVPFEALLKTPYKPDGKPVDYRKLDFLIKHFDISYHYSATLYTKGLQERASLLADDKRAANTLIGFAPVFRDDDQTGFTLASNDLPMLREANEKMLRSVMVDGRKFSELTHSEDEVKSIVTLKIVVFTRTVIIGNCAGSEEEVRSSSSILLSIFSVIGTFSPIFHRKTISLPTISSPI
jgi:hypothetical protein